MLHITVIESWKKKIKYRTGWSGGEEKQGVRGFLELGQEGGAMEENEIKEV